MQIEDMEATIQKIVDDCDHDRGRPDTVLKKWRAKLEKEPTLLQPFEIDKIVRAVRNRLATNGNKR